MSKLISGSIDPTEVDYYTRLANKWWETSGPFWPLHTLNKLRIDWIIKQLRAHGVTSSNEQPLSGLKVLDIGCGGGILSESLAKAGATVTGIDVVEKNITVATLHAEQENLNITYRYQAVEDLAESDEQFDVVFNMEVVEHVANVEDFMAASCALVKPDGFQFVATINRNWLAFIIAILGAEYVVKFLPKGTHRYSKLRKPSEIASWLNKAGLEVTNTSGVIVNPISRKMKTHALTWVNYMLIAKKTP